MISLAPRLFVSFIARSFIKQSFAFKSFNNDYGNNINNNPLKSFFKFTLRLNAGREIYLKHILRGKTVNLSVLDKIKTGGVNDLGTYSGYVGEYVAEVNNIRVRDALGTHEAITKNHNNRFCIRQCMNVNKARCANTELWGGISPLPISAVKWRG